MIKKKIGPDHEWHQCHAFISASYLGHHLEIDVSSPISPDWNIFANILRVKKSQKILPEALMAICGDH